MALKLHNREYNYISLYNFHYNDTPHDRLDTNDLKFVVIILMSSYLCSVNVKFTLVTLGATVSQLIRSHAIWTSVSGRCINKLRIALHWHTFVNKKSLWPLGPGFGHIYSLKDKQRPLLGICEIDFVAKIMSVFAFTIL